MASYRVIATMVAELLAETMTQEKSQLDDWLFFDIGRAKQHIRENVLE